MVQGFNPILLPDFKEERFKRTKHRGKRYLEDKLKHISQNEINYIFKTAKQEYFCGFLVILKKSFLLLLKET